MSVDVRRLIGEKRRSAIVTQSDCVLHHSQAMTEEWTAKTSWMRSVGATDAAWSTEGHLVHVKLGSAPLTEETLTQPSLSPEERERRMREERKLVASRASGGPVRRLGDS